MCPTHSLRVHPQLQPAASLLGSLSSLVSSTHSLSPLCGPRTSAPPCPVAPGVSLHALAHTHASLACPPSACILLHKLSHSPPSLLAHEAHTLMASLTPRPLISRLSRDPAHAHVDLPPQSVPPRALGPLTLTPTHSPGIDCVNADPCIIICPLLCVVPRASCT